MGQPWHGSYGSYLEDDGAISSRTASDVTIYLYVADDAAIARELQVMEDSMGTMAFYDGAFGSKIVSSTDSAWEGNRGGTSANCGGTYDDHGGSANRGGTSIRVTNVQTRAGGEVDLDNMSYEEMHRFEESMGGVSKGLSKEAISRLPAHKYNPSSTRSNSGDAE
ncbi:RING/U-BOX SUPERFAMILY PROTEIN [Salix viminalis]|uniref:RING/U-BOX SUPERFAMILY PROTEIN n=1 Tax=Salix viminalis TaxID=40686 RepID=A0A9Q0SCH8_SALVM|nr:RING/U-BOX SUPERFAMILY PROTEIN [Salix viminalis]